MNDKRKNPKGQPQNEPPEETAIAEIAPPDIHAYERAEIDTQIATAHMYPRSVTRFQSMALTMATVNVTTAASCYYCLKRKDSKTGKVKNIEGPSIRLAEIVGSSWGNMRYAARIIREEEKFVVAQGMAHDLERNVATTIEVKRRIWGKSGRYSIDMIGVTSQAAISIALRNAIFKVIPKTFVDELYAAAKKTAVGGMNTLAARRDAAIKYFGEQGVIKARVLAALDKEGIADIDLHDLELMIGWSTAIKDNEVGVDSIFPPVDITPRRKSEMQGETKDEVAGAAKPMTEEEKKAILDAERNDAEAGQEKGADDVS